MFRRRTTALEPAPVDSPPSPALSAAQLGDAGWILPKGLAPGRAGTDPSWTLVGTVGSPTAAAVDPAGLLVGEGWSLDWWIGADDRWHHPAREASVRQTLLGDVPIVETLLRIPGGDAVHRAYGMRSPRRTGDEWVVVEMENRTPVPVGIALVIRPFMADSLGSISEITIEPVGGGAGRDVAHLVRVDGRPALVLPRRPLVLATGNLASGDVVATVDAGRLLDADAPLVSATCPDGAATMALVYPVAHTATFRAVLPVGDVDRAEAIGFPAVVPDSATVVSGWEVHRRGPWFELPEAKLDQAVERARTQLLLAHDGEAVHRDGVRSPDLDPGATELILGALDLLDRPADVGTVVARWTERLADAEPEVDALVLTAVARHWTVHRIDALLDWMLPEVSAAVERIDRADRRGRIADPVARGRAHAALTDAAGLLDASGQAGAAGAVRSLADRMAASPAPVAVGLDPADRLVDAARRIAAGDRSGLELLDRELVSLTTTGTWPGPGRGTRRIGHDLAAAGALIDAARSLLVAERPDGLALLPVFPDGWYGGGIELHDVPTGAGRLSFGIRWHGMRPALLWELEPHEGAGPVTLTIPGLDPNWSTQELRGDALLAEVAPPEGFDLIREVAEHPGLQEHMRPEADDAAPAAPAGAPRRRLVLMSDDLDPADVPTGIPPGEPLDANEVSDLGPALNAGDMTELLRSAGMNDEQILRAREDRHLELLAIEHLVLPEPAEYDLVGISEVSGLTPDQVTRLWRSLGFAEPQPGDHLFTDVDVDMLRTIGQLVSMGWIDEELTIQMARVIGSSLSRVATALVDSIDPDEPRLLSGRPQSDDGFAAIAPLLLPMLLQVMDYVWRRHVQAEARARMAREHAGGDPDHRVVGFADLVGFTALSQQIDAHELAAVVARFETIAYDTVNRLGGRVVKMIGDEVMFTVPDEASAVEIALSLSETYRDDDELSDVRVGLSAGPVLQREADLFGPVVNRASRIVNIAFPGSVVVSGELVDSLAESEGLTWKSIGSRNLKDIGKVPLFLVRRASAEEPTKSSRQEAESRRAERREARVAEMEDRRRERRAKRSASGSSAADPSQPSNAEGNLGGDTSTL